MGPALAWRESPACRRQARTRVDSTRLLQTYSLSHYFALISTSLPQLALFARVPRRCTQARLHAQSPHCGAATALAAIFKPRVAESESNNAEGVSTTQRLLCTVLGNDAQLPSVLPLLLSSHHWVVGGCLFGARHTVARGQDGCCCERGQPDECTAWPGHSSGQSTPMLVGLCWTSGMVPIAVGGGGYMWACNRCKRWHIVSLVVSLKRSILSFGFLVCGLASISCEPDRRDMAPS
jgi:hypothetical protein